MRRAWSCWGLRAAVLGVVVLSATLLLAVPAALASNTRQRVLSLAEQEIGYHDHGDYCTKFGPCESWCSLFVTWVWERAGVPIPSLAFTGYVFDWAQASTYVLRRREVPEPGDAVLFGTGPASVFTSLHTGIVEAVYPGYLVTIEGNSLHAVRRYVVPLRNPQLVGEPGPIYGYASPVAVGGLAARRPAISRFPGPQTAMIARQHPARPAPTEQQRLVRAIAALRAFQHMPFRIPQVLIDWTGVTRAGLVEVQVSSTMPLSDAQRAWQSFLRRFDDAGHAYTVSFQTPPDPPAGTSLPTISGNTSVGQTLTESHGSWTNNPTAYAYQWEDCDAAGQSCSAISGATSQTYTLTATDSGDTIRVQETASNATGPGQVDTSAATPVVTAATPADQSSQAARTT
jgi:CHAP domain